MISQKTRQGTRVAIATLASLSISISTVLVANTGALASTTENLSGVSLDFNDVGGNIQVDGQSGVDFGPNFAVGSSLNYLNVGPNGLNAKVTYLSETGVDVVGFVDSSDSDPGNNRMMNFSVDFDPAGSPAIDRYAEFEVEFYRDIAQTYTPVTVSNLQLSIYDIDNLQYAAIDKASTYQLSEYTVINDSRIGQSRWEFFSGDLSTSTTSTPNATTRSAFSQGRVTVSLASSTKYTFRLGVSKTEPSSSGAIYILDFGPGLAWGSRAGLDAPQTIQASSTPLMSDAVAFNANGGTGVMASQRAATTTALTSNTFTRSGFNFNGWNTSRNGSGTAYVDGASFPFTAGTNVTELFAQWVVAQNTNVTFDANGGTGSMTLQTASSAAALMSNTFTRPGFTFAGWNTQANGSGTSYADGANFPFATDTTLYAQWTPVVAAPPAIFNGPVPVALSISCKPAGQATLVTLTGQRLQTITGASVNGQPITVSDVQPNSLKLSLPGLAAGRYSINYSSSAGNLVHKDALRVCGSTATVTPKPETFTVSKRFTGYRGDRGPVVTRDLRAITAFIKANPGLTSVTCTGSTSGVPAKATDAALATARAQNACRVVSMLVPGIKTSIAISTGQGTGQFFRAVTISGEGVR